MSDNRKDVVLLYSSIICFFIMSFSVLLMSLNIPSISQRALSVIISSVFWGSMIAGIILQVILEKRREEFIRKYRASFYIPYQLSGIFSFRKNKYGLVADISCVLSVILTIIAMFATKSEGYICNIGISVVVFSFCMHCILNGRIFYYIQNKNKILSDIEGKIREEKE